MWFIVLILVGIGLFIGIFFLLGAALQGGLDAKFGEADAFFAQMQQEEEDYKKEHGHYRWEELPPTEEK